MTYVPRSGAIPSSDARNVLARSPYISTNFANPRSYRAEWLIEMFSSCVRGDDSHACMDCIQTNKFEWKSRMIVQIPGGIQKHKNGEIRTGTKKKKRVCWNLRFPILALAGRGPREQRHRGPTRPGWRHPASHRSRSGSCEWCAR